MSQYPAADKGVERLQAHRVAFEDHLRQTWPSGYAQLAMDSDWFGIRHGDWPRWMDALGRLPEPPVDAVARLDTSAISLASATFDETSGLERALRDLLPWRKGPFDLLGVHIDTEWRSDWKWDRLVSHIQPLGGRRVLDVGCGSGYHLWRMLGAGAAVAVGIEPMPLFLAQFVAVAHLLDERGAMIMPRTLERYPRRPVFDTVFSMGVLYHRRDPLGHLRELAECLRPGGELVLETLVVEGGEHTVLMPTDRYASMRNVWFLPSPALLSIWLQRLGFMDVRVVDVTPTSTGEQRYTEWIGPRLSLADFLDPKDRTRTVEGYPAPIRATLLARWPG